MARIETYGRDTVVTGLDKVIGTDRESGKATKNYEMSAIRAYILEGTSVGTLKVTHISQDVPLPSTERPDLLLNNLDPAIEISSHEIVIVSLVFNDSLNEGKLTKNVYMFNKMDVTIGFEEYETTPEDFILLSSDVEVDEVSSTTVSSTDLNVVTTDSNVAIDTDGLIESIGVGEDVYKGYESNKHQFKKIKSTDNSVTISTDSDSVNLSVDIPNTPSVGVQRDFYVTGDGETNPVVFLSDFNGGLVTTTRTFLKEVQGYNYYRVEIKGQISLPTTLSVSDSFMQVNTNYRPIVYSADFDKKPVLIGSLGFVGSAGSFGTDVHLELPMIYKYSLGEVVLGYEFSDIVDPTEDITTEQYGYLSLDYISSDRPIESEYTLATIGNNSTIVDWVNVVDFVFNSSDFTTNTTPIYSDPDGYSPSKLKVLDLPALIIGKLVYNGVDVVVGQEIDFSDIDLGLFVFSPSGISIQNDRGFYFTISDSTTNLFALDTGFMLIEGIQ